MTTGVGVPVLLQHQQEGIDFLLDRKVGLLAFEQGLGKTRVAAEAFERLLSSGAADRLVVICPNSLKRTWANELTRFAPQLDWIVVEGSAATRRRLLATTDARVVIVNFELARNEIMAIRAFMTRRPCVLVVDESHYIKNYRSLNSVAAQHLAPLTKYRWLLTGTPVTNAPVDLYGQLSIIAETDALGSLALFEATYGRSPSGPKLAALGAMAAPYLLRRTKEQCLDLPEKTFVDVLVELAPWQRKLYDGMRDDLVHEVEGMRPEQFRAFTPTAMTRLLRLSQIASNPGLILPDEKRVPAKIAQLDELLDELVGANGRKVIVWSYYVDTIRMLEKRYVRFGAASLYGETPVAERQTIATRFQEDPGLMVLIANPAAAGTGFTLTAANYTIYETLTWRYDLYAQSQDRNHRIGQRNPVTYIRLLADDTIEHVVVEALSRKATMAGDLMGDSPGRSPIAEMSPSQFLRLLNPGREPGLVPHRA